MTPDLHEIPLRTITGEETSLDQFAGQVVLIVNVASQCGLTPQYEGLERLYESYRGDGFAVLGFPANDFAGQEPGSDAEIAGFCETSYGIEFPMFSKIAVTGEAQHPLYAALVAAAPVAKGYPDAFRAKLTGYGITPNPAPGVLWNFEKFLIGRDGEVVGRFAPDVAPDDAMLTRAIERELFASE